MYLIQRPPETQFSLWCRSCGASATLVRGFCRACYAAHRRDLLLFAGLRSRILARDRHSCRACGEPSNIFDAAESVQGLHVHHRRPGVSREKLLISLCPGHHALIHKLQVLDRLLTPLLAELWREQHPKAPEQLILAFGQQAEPLQPAAWLWEEARLA